jgi:hypothetical protein
MDAISKTYLHSKRIVTYLMSCILQKLLALILSFWFLKVSTEMYNDYLHSDYTNDVFSTSYVNKKFQFHIDIGPCKLPSLK